MILEGRAEVRYGPIVLKGGAVGNGKFLRRCWREKKQCALDEQGCNSPSAHCRPPIKSGGTMG